MNRARGQTVILFALLLLPLIGFLGLALDGGYYFLATRALTMAADSAARAAAVDVQYGQSTKDPLKNNFPSAEPGASRPGLAGVQ